MAHKVRAAGERARARLGSANEWSNAFVSPGEVELSARYVLSEVAVAQRKTGEAGAMYDHSG